MMSLKQLPLKASPLADYWIVYDNSQFPTKVIAEKTINSPVIIYQPQVWQQFAQKHC